MRFTIMTLNITTHSIMTFRISISNATLSMTLSLMKFSIMTLSIMKFSIKTLSIMTLSILIFRISLRKCNTQHNDTYIFECCYAQYLLCVVSLLLSVIILNFIMLNVIMLNAIILNVVAPAMETCEHTLRFHCVLASKFNNFFLRHRGNAKISYSVLPTLSSPHSSLLFASKAGAYPSWKP